MAVFLVIAPVAVFALAMVVSIWLGSKKRGRDWKAAVEAAKTASGWVPDKAIYVNGDCYMAAGYRIEDKALVLYRSYVRHFANVGGPMYWMSPIRTETVVKVFAPGKWDGVVFEGEQ